MKYNFVKKIRNHEFSMKEDFNQSMENLDNLIQKLSPFYRKIGVEKLVKSSERILGKLSDESRAEVETAYTVGTIALGLGIATGEPFYYIAAGANYGIGLLHHSAMKENK